MPGGEVRLINSKQEVQHREKKPAGILSRSERCRFSYDEAEPQAGSNPGFKKMFPGRIQAQLS
jgi:hypothetical protein